MKDRGGMRSLARRRRPQDLWVLAAVGILCALGVVMVFNTSYFYASERFGDPYHFLRKHMLAVAVGTLTMAVASRLPVVFYRRLAYPALGLAALGLVVVLVPGLGVARGGAQRWLCLGGFSVQPSEFAKGAVVLYLADSLARKGGRVREFVPGVLPQVIVVGLLALLIGVEPDFGSAALLGMLLFAMLFAAGARFAHVAAMGLAAAPLLVVAVLQSEYRLRRVLSFVNPWRDPQDVGFQLSQSLIAFGSGGWSGVGLGASRQKMFYLPEAHTDFVYSVIGEELGLLGAVAVLVLFSIIAVRGLRIVRRQPQRFGSLLGLGMTVAIAGQALVNMSVVLGLLPTKGLPLPYLSYGGSATVAAMTNAGVLLALSREAG